MVCPIPQGGHNEKKNQTGETTVSSNEYMYLHPAKQGFLHRLMPLMMNLIQQAASVQGNFLTTKTAIKQQCQRATNGRIYQQLILIKSTKKLYRTTNLGLYNMGP